MIQNQTRYNCEQSELYAVADVAWGSCLQEIVRFATFSERYTEAYVTMAKTGVAAAEAIPSAQARGAVSEILRTQLVILAEQCRDKWQLLKRYITKSVPKEALKASLEAAGSADYEKAIGENWDKVRALNTAGLGYAGEHLAALQANQNMPTAFGTEYNTLKADFAALYTQFLDARETAKQGTASKIDANNMVYDSLMDMMLDGQQLFKNEPATAEQFVFAEVLKSVSSAGPAGIKGTIAGDDGTVITEALIDILDTDKSGSPDADGKYEIKPVPNGTYAIQVTAPGYEMQLIEGYKISLGTVSTLDIVMVAVSV